MLLRELYFGGVLHLQISAKASIKVFISSTAFGQIFY
jgi:hypothetical protein